jgi:hypothetical protein
MACKLPVDCLNGIFEYLEKDKYALHSCLLINCLWCETSVQILWRNIWYFKKSYYRPSLFKVSSSILSTLIACLPNESKELLYNNKIFISTPTSKSPLFNYAALCNDLSIDFINEMVECVIEYELKFEKCLVKKQIIKLFIDQISSLKRLTNYSIYKNWFSFHIFSWSKKSFRIMLQHKSPF